jgi:Cu(I)/Ag(I) efflux system protein CusF
MKIKRIVAAALFLSLAFTAVSALAQEAMVNGEVKKIDEAAGKITLKHGPIKKLDMDDDSMTMVFRIKDPAMLKSLKVGDNVKFDADRVNGQITVTAIQKSK